MTKMTVSENVGTTGPRDSARAGRGASACCAVEAQAVCCEPAAKAACCGTTAGTSCGCQGHAGHAK
jgi:hypothetical protein